MINNIIEILSQYPHFVLWSFVPVVLVLSLLYRKNSFDLKFKSSSYVINYFFLGMVLIFGLLVMGLSYQALLLSGARLLPSLIIFHTLATLCGTSGIVYFFTVAGTPHTLEMLRQRSEERYYQKVEGIKSGLILFVLIFMAGQLMFSINMIIGIVSQGFA